MKYKETDMEMEFVADAVSGEDTLNEIELSRLQFFAEHPELADPVIAFLP